MGDRRDHFMSLQDITELFRVIVEERKRREFDPTLILLRECANESIPRRMRSRNGRSRPPGVSGSAEQMA